MSLLKLLGLSNQANAGVKITPIASIMKQKKVTVAAPKKGPAEAKKKAEAKPAKAAPAKPAPAPIISTGDESLDKIININNIGKDKTVSAIKERRAALSDSTFKTEMGKALAAQDVSLADAEGRSPFENTQPLLARINESLDSDAMTRTGKSDLNFFENMYRAGTGKSLGLQNANKDNLKKLALAVQAQKMANEAQALPAKGVTELFKSLILSGDKTFLKGQVGGVEKPAAAGRGVRDLPARTKEQNAAADVARSFYAVADFAKKGVQYVDKILQARTTADAIREISNLQADFSNVTAHIRKKMQTGMALTQNEERFMKGGFPILSLTGDDLVRTLGNLTIGEIKEKYRLTDLKETMKRVEADIRRDADAKRIELEGYDRPSERTHKARLDTLFDVQAQSVPSGDPALKSLKNKLLKGGK